MTDYYKLYRKQQIQIESLLAELDTRTMERDYWHNATAFALKQNKNDNNRLRQDIAKLTDENERLRAALEQYANPAFYHAIMFMFDRPCGGFADDFSDDHGDAFYDRPMPGKAAREALQNKDKDESDE